MWQVAVDGFVRSHGRGGTDASKHVYNVDEVFDHRARWDAGDEVRIHITLRIHRDLGPWGIWGNSVVQTHRIEIG